VAARTPDDTSPSAPADLPDLRRLELVELTREPKAQPTGIPGMLVAPDGRIQLNTEAMRRLGTATDRPRAIRLYTDRNRRYLIIQRADPADAHAIRLFPVGRKEERWPQVHVARAATIMRELGLLDRARYTLTWDKRRGWLVADLKRPEPVAPGVPTDQIRPLLEEWAKQATPDHAMTRREFWSQVQKIARERFRRRTPLLQRQLAAYLHRHREELARDLGLEIVEGGGSPTYILRRRR
jgi:hypothetical protein